MRTAAATAPRRSLSARSRTAVRSVAVGAASVAVIALSAGPAAASAEEGLGYRKNWELTPFELTLVFVGVPLLVFAVVIALVYGFSRNGEPRLREGQSWWTEPDFNTRESIGIQDPSVTATAGRTTDGGGAGAAW